jgi:hypothetical protein
MNNHTILSWMTFLPLIGAALILPVLLARASGMLKKEAADQAARVIALVASGLVLVLGFVLWREYDSANPGMQFAQQFKWIPAYNIEYFVGVDGISITLVMLTALISFIATIASMPWWPGNAHLDEHHFPENVEHEEVEADEYSQHARFQGQHPGIELALAPCNRRPRDQAGDGGQQRGQHQQQHTDAVYPHRVVDTQLFKPGIALEELDIDGRARLHTGLAVGIEGQHDHRQQEGEARPDRRHYLDLFLPRPEEAHGGHHQWQVDQDIQQDEAGKVI